MIWLMWRQHRTPLLYALLVLVALAAVMIPSGRAMNEYLRTSGLGECLRSFGDSQMIVLEAQRGCVGLVDAFETRYAALLAPATLLLTLPVLAGMFLGAPLVAREVEQGTHRLVWTQGISRLRWGATKLSLVGLGAAVLAAGYAGLANWWFDPLLRATRNSRFDFPAFDLQGITPVAYTVFAVALGVFVGTVVRRTLPAMAITLVAYTVVRASVTNLARPRYAAPEELTFPVAGTSVPNEWRGDWVFERGVYDDAGNLVAADSMRMCPPDATGGCPPIGDLNRWSYHPADRFWLFQYIETGIFVALAAVLLLLALHRIRTRVT